MNELILMSENVFAALIHANSTCDQINLSSWAKELRLIAIT